MTSAHSPPTRGTIAPSTLSNCTAGPGGPSGNARSSAATASVSTATWAAPAASVRRRTVSAPTRTPVKWASRAAASAKGTEAPSRTRPSTSQGVSGLPGSSPKRSSRGGKPGAAGRAPQVGAGQLQRDVASGAQRPGAGPAPRQPLPALGAALLVVGEITRDLGQQPRPRHVQAGVEGLLDLGQGGGYRSFDTL